MKKTNRQIAQKIIQHILESMAKTFEQGTPIHEMSKEEILPLVRDWVNNTEKILDDNFNGSDGQILEAYFDGSASPNPGPMSIGYCIKNNLGNTILEDRSNLGDGTNNQAEYIALFVLIGKLVKMNPEYVKIMGDSQLVIKQVNGEWAVKNEDLKTHCNAIKDLLRKLKKFDLVWVKRDQNKDADRLSKRI